MEKRIITSNGVTIRYYENSAVGGFSLSLFLRAGSMFESEDENGSAHFFEHTVFRHLNKLHNGRFYHLLDACGLTMEATTGVKCVEFNISGAAKHFRTAAEIFSEIFEPITLSGAEIAPERGRIKAEIREEDNAGTLEHFCDEAVWQGSSLSRTVSGSAPRLDRLGIKALKGLQKRLLSPENICFYAAGRITEEDVSFLAKKMEKKCLYHSERLKNEAPVPTAFRNRPKTAHVKNAPFSAVRICFDSPGTAEELPALYLLWDMLFGGETSILHDRLSERTGLTTIFRSSR